MIGGLRWLNVDRFAFAYPHDAASGGPAVVLYLPERGGLESEFTFRDPQAERLRSYLAARGR